MRPALYLRAALCLHAACLLAALCASALPFPVLAATPARAADGVVLAAHHAVYKLNLDNSSGDVVAGGGSMDYEVTDACDGWATRQRLEMNVTNTSGQDISMVTDYATWESKDGLSMRFHMTQSTDTAVTEQVDGTAKLDAPGGPGSIHYSSPEDKTVALPAGTLFPTAHTEALLGAAEAGRKFITLPIFDGTGDKGAQDSSVVIANWNGPGAAPGPALAELPSGRVRIAFFDRQGASQKPDYEVAMRYWSNGVADDLLMEFGDFAMKGTMSSFKLNPGRC